VGYTGKLTYIYGSRQAWALASITDRTNFALASLIPTDGDVPATIPMVLRRLDISPEEITQQLEVGGFPKESWSRNLTPDEAGRLRTIVRDDPAVQLLVRDRAKRARDLVLTYLEQVGAVTDEHIGFVDLGTGATLFNALSSILATVGQQPPTGFYFGLRSQLPETGFGRPLTYIRDADERVGFLRTPGLLTLVELACTADHGSVVGYAEGDAGVVPVFSTQGNEPVVAWGLPIVRETVARVARELLLDSDLSGVDSIDLRPAVLAVFNLFWNTPTKAEAIAWGAYPFEDGWGNDATRRSIAEPQRLHRLARKPHRHFWHGGAQQLSGPLSRSAFHSVKLLLVARDKVRQRTH